MELTWAPPAVPAGPQRIEVRTDDELIGDIDIRVCDVCRLGVVEHIRVDPPHRRRGVAAAALHEALDAYPEFRWTTTTIEPDAEVFWERVSWHGLPAKLGAPNYCAHMRIAESLSGYE